MILDSINQRLILACFSRNVNQPLTLQQIESITYLNQHDLEMVVDKLMSKQLLTKVEESYYLHNDHYLEVLKSELILYEDLIQFVDAIKLRLDEVWLMHEKTHQGFDLNKPTLLIDTFSGNQSFIIKAFSESKLKDLYQLEISNALNVINRVSVMDHEVFIENAPIALFTS